MTQPSYKPSDPGKISGPDPALDAAQRDDQAIGSDTDQPAAQPAGQMQGQSAGRLAGQSLELMPGQLLARGVCRHLASLGFAVIEEFVPERGKRVDVMALGRKGELWVIECKSSRADFQSDAKWTGYLDWCDRYFWAVDEQFPTDLLPEGTGLIIADAYDAEILRMAPEARLSGARRSALVRRFATHAARRLHALRDPEAMLDGGF